MAYPIDNSTVYAAIITAGTSAVAVVMTLLWNSRAVRNERQRDQYAAALATVLEYWEFAYIIQRREPDASGTIRAGISIELNRVQKDLAHHTAWMSIGSRRTQHAYKRLVSEARRVAGGAMHEAWNTGPRTADSDMNLEKLDDKLLREYESAYIIDVADHLATTPASIRRLVRWIRGVVRHN